MKRLLAIAIVAAVLSASCGRERLASAPPGIHLRSGKSIDYYLDKGASDAVELAVRESFQLWSDATAFKFTYRGKAPGRIARDGRNMVILMTRWPTELPIGLAAWTQLYLDASGKIVESDLLLNAKAFSFTEKREAKPGSVYLEDVLAKEIGQSLGVGLGQETGGADRYRKAAPGDGFEPGIDPGDIAAYLSLYEADKAP
jgi:hypothetical protein